VELSPMESWIQHLMHNVLVKRTIDKVLKYLRKLHWEDPEVSSISAGSKAKAEWSGLQLFTEDILECLGTQIWEYRICRWTRV